MSAFKVNILTPTKKLGDAIPADSLLIPTVNGQINVLPEHSHLISVLDTGILTLINGNSSEKFAVTTGTIKVFNDEIIILAQVAEKAGEIDITRAEKALKNAEISLPSCKDEAEIVKYQRKLMRAKLRIELAKNFK